MKQVLSTLIFLCITSVSIIHAQILTVINTGTAGTPAYNAGPIYRSSASSGYDASRYAYLYTQSELAAAGIMPGTVITQLGWIKNNNATTTGGGIFRIYMKNSAATDFAAASETWANLNAGTTLVYENLSQTVPTTMNPDYITFPLNTFFVYTGGSLEISTEWDITAVSGNPSTAAFDWMWSTVVNRIYGTGNTTLAPITTLSSTTNSISTIDDRRPFIQIGYLSGAAVDGSLNDLVAPTTLCPGTEDVVVEFGNFGTDTINELTIQWSVNGVAQAPFTSADTIAPFSNVNITLGSYNFLGGTNYAIEAIITSVNNGADGNASNDTLLVTGISAGLSGTYTIDSSIVTGGANFQSFTDFASALQTLGVCGPVIANVAPLSGPYNEQFILNEVLGASAINTITVNGNLETLAFASTNTNERGVVKLNGADHLTIDSLVITATGTYGFGVQLINGADSNTISNCIIDAGTAVTSTNYAGIAVSNSATSATGTGASSCDYNTITGNTITGGYYGITLVANGSTSVIVGNRVTNNTIADFYQYGIYLNGNDGALIEGNDISRPVRSNPTTFYGVYFTAVSHKSVVSKNRIHNPFDGNTASTSAAFGVYFTAADATLGNENRVINNLIYHFNGNGNHNGIFNNGSDYVSHYHNTIVLDDANSTCTICGARGFYNQTNPAVGLEFKNNLIYITRAGGGESQGLYFDETSTFKSDYNNYYINGAGLNEIGYYTPNGYATLNLWIAAVQNDSNSVALNPLFTNPSGGNFMPTSIALNDQGVPVGVADDILGTVRDATTPDIGAYEFDVAATDAGINAIDVDACPGTDSIYVTVQNFGATAITSVTVHTLVDGVPTANSGNTFAVNIPAAGSLQINMGAVTFSVGNTYTITAFTSLPNGAPDANAPNDTAILTVNLALTGTYTINSAQLTGGTNFQSFTDAATALNTYGVCGPVTLNVVSGSGPYNEQIVFNQINGASAVNTITINGNGETLSFDATSTLKYVLRLNGTDYLTIDSLKIVGLNATYGFGILLSNNADNNIIRDCEIDLSAITSTSTTNSCGICLSASVTSPTSGGNNANYNQITNNLIKGGTAGGPYYGITLYGTTGAVGCNSNIVTGNTIIDFYNTGIRLSLTSACEIVSNDISRPNITVGTAVDGISVIGASNPKTKIIKNRIHDIYGANALSTGTFTGIDITSDGGGVTQEILIANNAIYDITHNGIDYGIYLSGSFYTNVYHNSISLDNTAATGTSTVRGVYMLGTSDSINVMNNIISITRGGTGAMYGLYYTSLPAGLESDFNVVYVNSATGTNNFGYNGSAQPTLASWLSTSFRDSSSVEINPLFASPSTGDLTPAAAGINDIGADLTAFVPDDILGNARPSTPDPGAFEFTPSLDDAGVISITSPFCPGTDSILVTVQNFGAAPLTSVIVHVTANGVPSSSSAASFAVNLLPGEDTVLNLGTVTYTAGIIYDVVAFTSQPNGASDANNANDTSTVQITLGLTGSYTINSALATSGTNFQSFSDFENAVNNYGVCGPVVVDVVPGSGPYNEQIEFLDVAGVSTINTVTIHGNGETLTFSPTSTLKYVLRLNGTDYFTFDSLKVVGANATYGFGILLSNNADHNVITECEIDLSAVTSTTSTNSCGICLSASVTSPASGGNNGSDNEISNNHIKGGSSGGPYYGMTLYGTTGAVGCDSNRVIGNTLTDFYNNGIRLNLSSNSQIVDNDLSRPNHTSAGTFEGIYLTGTSNPGTQILKNRLHNSHGANMTNTSSLYAIDITTDGQPGNEVLVANNTVYDINHNGPAYPIYVSGSLYSNYYHNSISLDHTTATGTTTSRGIYLLGSFDNVKVKNNAVSVTRGGTGVMYGLYYNSLPANLESDYNAVYVNAASPSSYFGYNGATQATLSDWISTSNLDSNSISINPDFISTTDLHSTSPFLNDRGALGTGITEDMDGEVRCPNPGCPGNTLRPDIGADEFLGAPVTVDVGTISVISPAQKSCYSANETVAISIKNFNTQVLDFSLYPVTVSAVAAGPNPITFAPVVLDSSSLAPDSTLIITFDTAYNMSVPGTYTFDFYVSQGSDANPGNDSLLDYSVEFTVGTIANTFSEVCSGSAFELRMTGITGPIHWQSFDVVNNIWVDETGPGADSVAYVVTPTDTMFYRALVCGSYPSATDTLIPIVVPAPTVSNDTVCSGTNATVIATGAGVKNWYTALTGGNLIFTGDTLVKLVTADTTFYVESSQTLTGGGGSLKITEIFVDDPDALEIQNLSTSAINTTGWVVAISDNYSNINVFNSVLWNLPASIGPGQILTRNDNSSSPNYWGDNMLWNPANGSTRGWAMILDNQGNVVDFVIWDNWPAGALNNFNPTINGFSVTVGNEWVGDTASTTGIGTQSLARIGSADHNDRSDFVFQPSSIGVQNPGLSNAFQGGSCSSSRVPAFITVNPSPVVNLGADTTQCEGTVTLNAGNAGGTYIWNTADNTQTITVDSSGTYAVTVTSANGCTDNDAINVNIAPYPVANLGNDTAICGGFIILSTSNFGNIFNWSTGSTAAFITVTASGNYSVTVTTPAGCSRSDSVAIQLNPLPVVSLINDTAQCGGSVTLDAGNAGNSFAWSTGATTQIITASSTGTYVVTVTDANNCSAQDAVDVSIFSFPAVDLGSDISQCEGTVTLDAGNAGSNFLWSTGAVTQSISVTASGSFSVQVTNTDGCATSDTVNVTINTNPDVLFTITADTICSNESPIVLTANPSGGVFSGSGVSGSTFNPATAGLGTKTITYSFTDNNGCSASASDNIEVVTCVGIEEAINDLSLTIYPNPSPGVVQVKFAARQGEKIDLAVYNADGQLVRLVKNMEPAGIIDLSGEAAGTYMFKVISSDYSVVKPIVIE